MPPVTTAYHLQKKSGSVRRHMTSYLSHEVTSSPHPNHAQVNTYTIEVSMLGYEDLSSRQIIPYTDDLYAKVPAVLYTPGSRSAVTSPAPSGTTTK